TLFPPLASSIILFSFTHPATTEIYTLSLHDALPILRRPAAALGGRQVFPAHLLPRADRARNGSPAGVAPGAVVKDRLPPGQVLRSEEHTSELQSRFDLVCRLLLEKKKKHTNTSSSPKKLHIRQIYRAHKPLPDADVYRHHDRTPSNLVKWPAV